MRRSALLAGVCLLFVSIPVSLLAQKKNFTYEQLFNNASAPHVMKPLPAVRGWVDDNHYIEIQKNAAGKLVPMSVDVKTGKAVPYHGVVEDNRRSQQPLPVSVPDGRNVTLSPDKQWVAYTKKDNNLYVMEVATKKETQLTKDGADAIYNGYASWVYYEEILGRASRYKAFWWSPDSKRICFMRFDDSQVPVFSLYVSEGQHGYLEKAHYPKAGDKNPEVKIGIAGVNGGNITWADFNPKEDQYFGAPYWTPSGELWVQWMNRGQDNLKIYAVNLNNGSKTTIYDEKQSTWISLDDNDRIEFLPDGSRFILKSDKDGWENLYLHDKSGRLINRITEGNFWGTSILKVDAKAKQVWFRARKENSARFDIYRTGFNGKGLTRMSFGEYSHDQVHISPGGKYFITLYSNLSTPATMALVDSKGKIIRELGNSKGEDFNTYNLPRYELKRVKSADGLFDLPVLITYPINFDPNKKYPVLVSIYGGPNAGTVYDRWRNPGGMSQWWAQEGMILVSFDNRSSGHFGKKGLNFIHRQLGKWEIEDYMTCATWLKQQSWVDGNRLCITGGSFGGYMTCMALTYGADVFTHGIANSSVTDWRFYDTHYTERFMDTPEENPEGYKLTSVMTYAGKYKGLLRIIHGTSDDNVHIQNSLVLIDKLQDLKKHFEFMVYPGERHGIGGLKGMHNRTEAYQFIYDNLLKKQIPGEFWESTTTRRSF